MTTTTNESEEEKEFLDLLLEDRGTRRTTMEEEEEDTRRSTKVVDLNNPPTIPTALLLLNLKEDPTDTLLLVLPTVLIPWTTVDPRRRRKLLEVSSDILIRPTTPTTSLVDTILQLQLLFLSSLSLSVNPLRRHRSLLLRRDRRRPSTVSLLSLPLFRPSNPPRTDSQSSQASLNQLDSESLLSPLPPPQRSVDLPTWTDQEDQETRRPTQPTQPRRRTSAPQPSPTTELLPSTPPRRSSSTTGLPQSTEEVFLPRRRGCRDPRAFQVKVTLSLPIKSNPALLPPPDRDTLPPTPLLDQDQEEVTHLLSPFKEVPLLPFLRRPTLLTKINVLTKQVSFIDLLQQTPTSLTVLLSSSKVTDTLRRRLRRFISTTSIIRGRRRVLRTTNNSNSNSINSTKGSSFRSR